MKINIPIIHIINKKYLIGVKFEIMKLKDKVVHVMENEDSEISIRLTDYINQNSKKIQKELCFYMSRSAWSLEKVVQTLIDGN